MPESLTMAPQVRALVVDDSEWSARSLETILGPRGFAVLRAFNGRQAVDLVRMTPPDVVLVAARLPDLSGSDIVRVLRAEPSCGPCTPVLVIASGPLGRADRLESLSAGAWDVLSQPLDVELLLCKLDTFLAVRRDTIRLAEGSLLDEQTGFYNARGLARRARELGAEAFRLRAPLACVALSVDVPADGMVASAGLSSIVDRVVSHLGAFLRRTSRLSDAVGRLGQAEFGIIAPCTGHEGAVQLINRLQLSVVAENFELDGARREVTLRAGYAAVPNYSQSTIDALELLLQATAALHHTRSSPTAPVVAAFESVQPTIVH